MEHAQVIEQKQDAVARLAESAGFAQAVQQIAQVAPMVARIGLETAAAMEQATGKPKHLSPARARLEQVRQTDKDAGRKPFEPIQTAEGELFIARLTWPEVYRVQLTASKGGNGVLDIRNNAHDLRDLSIVALADCVYSEANPTAKYFEGLQDAAEFVDSLEADTQLLGRLLFDACLEYNPSLLPKGVAGLPVPEPVDPAEREAAEADLAELLKDVPSRPVDAALPAEPQSSTHLA